LINAEIMCYKQVKRHVMTCNTDGQWDSEISEACKVSIFTISIGQLSKVIQGVAECLSGVCNDHKKSNCIDMHEL